MGGGGGGGGGGKTCKCPPSQEVATTPLPLAANATPLVPAARLASAVGKSAHV